MSDKFLFLASNYIDPSLVFARTLSSQDSLHVADNLFLANRRAKTWRSAGCFEIVAGSNTFQFRETAGVDLTATVPAGTYNSLSAFFTAVAAAMHSAGTCNYTLDQNPTNKHIRITSDRAGGKIFTLNFTNPASAAMADILGFSVGTLVTYSGTGAYTADSLRIHTSEWMIFDLGIGSNPKAFVLLGERNKAISLSSDATIKIQGNSTNVWTSPQFEQALPYDERAICSINTSGFGSYRYWRFQIVDRANPNGYLELSYAYLGEAYSTTRGGVQFPFKTTKIDRSSLTFSEGGYSYPYRRQRAEQYELTWNGLTISEKESFDAIWESKGMTDSFLVCLDPNGAFSSSKNYATKLVKFSAEPAGQLMSPQNFSLDMKIREDL